MNIIKTLLDALYFADIWLNSRITRPIVSTFERHAGVTSFGQSMLLCVISGATTVITFFFGIAPEIKKLGEYAIPVGATTLLIISFLLWYLYTIGKGMQCRYERYMSRQLVIIQGTKIVSDRRRMFWLPISIGLAILLYVFSVLGMHVAVWSIVPFLSIYPVLAIGSVRPYYKYSRIGQEKRRWKKTNLLVYLFAIVAWFVQVVRTNANVKTGTLCLIVIGAIVILIIGGTKPRSSSTWDLEDDE